MARFRCSSLLGKYQPMATTKQRQAAKRNVKKAISAAKSKRSIASMPKRTRTALGKQGEIGRAHV